MLFIAACIVWTAAARLFYVQYNKQMSAAAAPKLFLATTEPEAAQFDAWSNQTLLTSLELGGIAWPSSCRNGTCRTCIGQVVRGQVRYEIEWPGLSAEEKEQGYALPCVAYPSSALLLRRGDSS